MLFKNICFELSFPKIKIFKQFSLNFQASKHILPKIQGILQTWLAKPKSHNNMYKV